MFCFRAFRQPFSFFPETYHDEIAHEMDSGDESYECQEHIDR